MSQRACPIFSKALLLIIVGVANVGIQAATVKIANEPLNQLSLVKPNLMVTIDNSGSMQNEYMPDSQSSSAIGTRNNYNVNTLYYNPAIYYKPAKFADGTSMPSQTAANTCGTGSCEFTTPWTKVLNDPYLKISNTGNALSSPATSDLTNYTNGLNFAAGGGYPAVTKAPFYCKTSGCTGTDRVNIKPGSSYPKIAAREDCTGAIGATGCSYAEEMTNFANWYAYYSSRYQMAKAAIGQVFAELDDNYRIGLHTIGNSAQSSNNIFWLYVNDFVQGTSTSQKNKFFYNMYRFNDSNVTPLRAASTRIGEYFRAPSGADPIQYWCQRNFHMLVTDGYWNESTYSPPANAPEILSTIDKKVPTLPFKDDGTTNRVAISGLTTGADWPGPYYDASGNANVGGPTLADIAMYYWVTDLRPNYPTDPKAKNGLSASTANPATWQHLVFFGIGLGVGGNLANPGDLSALTAKTKSWPNPVKNNTASAVDDLWHAAINGHGAYFSATDPTSLTTSLLGVIANINSQSAAGTGAAVQNPVYTPGNNQAFQTTYTSGLWYGDMEAITIDPDTGDETSAGPIWSASAKLDAQTQPIPSTLPGRGYSASNRKIFTLSGTSGIPFQWSSLSAAQQTALIYKTLASGSTPARTGQQVIDYLRGDPTYEGTATGYFRSRGDSSKSIYGVLGDIVNFQPIYVGEPNDPWYESTNPGYQAFVTAKKNRTPMVYVGANDGMIHAFNASVGAYNPTTKTFAAVAASGREEWAYIPSMLIRATDDENGNADGIQSLSFRNEVNPRFKHHYFLDATPLKVDVDFSATWTGSGWPHDANYVNTATTKDWRTIIVGGLGKGGKGYYALDITDGAAGISTESAASSKILWEFTHPTLGYTYGQPLVGKTRAYGWVVVVSSGYNNSDGVGYIYIINPKTGALLKTLSTPAGFGTSTSPVNLVHIAPLSRRFNDVYIDQIYGGDTLGNLWRFDLSDPVPGNWTNATLVATFTSPTPLATGANYNGTQRQPVTSKPTFSIDKFGNRWVIVGTGVDLHQDDRDVNKTMTNQTQTVYFIKDGSSINPLTTGLPITRSNLVSQDRNSTGSIAVGSSSGWYMDLAPPDTSNPSLIYGAERMVKAPKENYGLVTFYTTVASSDVCTPGAEGITYVRSVTNGQSMLVENGVTVPFIRDPEGIVGAEVAKLADGTTAVFTTDSRKKRKRHDCKGGQCVGGAAAGRTSWREILQ